MPPVVYGALIIFLLSSAILVRMSTAIQVGYAVCAAVALGTPVLLQLSATPSSSRVRRGAVLAVACSCLFLIPAAILPEGRRVIHVLVDLSTTLLPIGFLVIGLTIPATFYRLLDRGWVAAFWLTALWAPLVIQTPEYARAFEPPDVGVIALVTTLSVRGRNVRVRIWATIGLLVLTALAGVSGSRSILLIALLACAVTVLSSRAAGWSAGVLVVAALLFGLLNSDVVRTAMSSGEGSRSLPRALTLFRAGRGDVSTSNRLLEINEVFAEMRRRPIAMVVGLGHGAVFEPEEWHAERNVSEEGYVHNIHFGPQLMVFRYGIAGLTIYLILLGHAVAVGWRSIRERDPPEAERARLLFALGTTLFLLEFLVRSVLPNPVFSFFVAGHIGLTIQSSAEYRSRRRAHTTG